MKTRSARAVVVLFVAAGAFASLGACGSDEVTIPPASADGAAPDGPTSDGTATPEAAATDAASSDANDAAPVIVDGPGKHDDMCTFNRDCMAALRCECSDPVGCSCQKGVRGTGRNGIDPCPGENGSNLCASALCVEGPDNKGFFCSDECKTDADCTGMLPMCTDIAFVGKVCVRSVF